MKLAIRTEPLGGSPLATEYLAGMLPPAWYAERPRSVDAWRDAVQRVRASGDLAATTSLLEPALMPTGRAKDRLARVAAEGGVVITTGQQPGLFGGPIYTWAKAFSALALADEVERVTGVAAAAVFWAATDDADFAEASRTTIAVPGGAEIIRLPDAPSPGTPMARAPLGDVRPLLDVLARGAGSASYGDALEMVRAAYVPTATVGGAYVALLRAVLEPFGVPVLDAAHPLVRRRASPILRRALSHSSDVASALEERALEIGRAGLEPQVPTVERLSLVFIERGGVRSRVPLAQATRVATAAPDEGLSPNVLLRPLIERAILPTVAYVGGPSEIAYFAQVSAVADALQLATPIIVPRWSGTILQPHVLRILRRYGLLPEDLRDPHAAESRLARLGLPDPIRVALETLRSSIDRGTAEIAAAEAATAEPVLSPRTLEGHRRGLQQRIERLERRYLASLKRRHEGVRTDIATARGALYPGGVRQERALNLMPLLARHGPTLLEGILEEARLHAQSLSGATAETTFTRA